MKYRIKAQYNRYEVQVKGLFGWKNCISCYHMPCSTSFPKTFYSYEEAKHALEEKIENDNRLIALKKKNEEFGTKYYYPPLPIHEPKE